MRTFKFVLVILGVITITAWLSGMATLGMQRNAEASTQVIVREGPIQDGPAPLEGERDAIEGSTDSNVDLYRAWLSSRGIDAEEDKADDLALATCAALDSGSTPGDVMTVASSYGFTTKQGAAIVIGAVRIYCPEHNDTVELFINGATGGIGA